MTTTKTHAIIATFCRLNLPEDYDAPAFAVGFIAGLQLAHMHPEYAMALAVESERVRASSEWLKAFPSDYPLERIDA